MNTKDLLERARDGLKIALVYAGDKNEPDAVIERQINSRDWKSYRLVAENIAETLEAEGFSDVVVLPEDRHLGDVISRSNIDLVWLNSGGVLISELILSINTRIERHGQFNQSAIRLNMTYQNLRYF